ncbi:TPA: zinc-binding dehydrogenase [Stenotrophomonas maltophilia]|nr:zinc-binding dehydrogenase [Stenotrophomonas maltophilia]
MRALRFTVEADGDELADIAALVASGKVRPHVEQVFPLVSAADALALVEQGHALGKVMLKVV